MESVLERHDARSSRGRAAELECCLDRLSARAGEQDPRQARGCALQQFLSEQSREKRYAELNRAGRLELERLDQRLANARIVPADVEHPETTKQVEVAVTVSVVEEIGRASCRERG